MDNNTIWEMSTKHSSEEKPEEAHDVIRDEFDFRFCPWCGIKLYPEEEEECQDGMKSDFTLGIEIKPKDS